ncbi:MAG: hypothetical protein ACREJ5_25965 [Geminicoccaceae bacterium]
MNEVKRTLENRFLAFLAQSDGAECIDETLSEAELVYGKRADFLMDHRRVILEVKSLGVDPEYKVEERLKPHRNRPEFPAFYWAAELNEILPHLPDGEEVRREIFHAVTRSVQSALENADDQIAATKTALGLTDACGVVAILNEKVGILAPEFVTAKASQMLRKTKNGGIRYRNIAYVWIIAESHRLAGKDGSEHLPLILLEGPTAAEHPVAGEYLNSLQPLWAAWRGVPFFDLGLRENLDGLKFEKRAAESASYPEQPLVRHEIWRRAYRADPYLRSLSGDDFLDHAARIIGTMAPHFLKGGRKLAHAAVAELMEGWTHVLEEAEHRRLDMRKLQARLPDLDVLRGREE